MGHVAFELGHGTIALGHGPIQMGSRRIEFGRPAIQLGSRRIGLGRHSIQLGRHGIELGSHGIELGSIRMTLGRNRRRQSQPGIAFDIREKTPVDKALIQFHGSLMRLHKDEFVIVVGKTVFWRAPTQNQYSRKKIYDPQYFFNDSQNKKRLAPIEMIIDFVCFVDVFCRYATSPKENTGARLLLSGL